MVKDSRELQTCRVIHEVYTHVVFMMQSMVMGKRM